MNMRELRIALRALAEIGQGLPNHEYREKIDQIIKATEELEDEANLERVADAAHQEYMHDR